MPMGGGGTRFGNKGFNLPKPLIELQGKPFFYWAVQSIAKFVHVQSLTFIVLQEHIDRFQIDKIIMGFYPFAKIIIIPHVLNGAVLTCLEGIKAIDDNYPILFNDCDHAFICKKFYNFMTYDDVSRVSGALLTFSSDSSNYSYVHFNEAQEVIGTVEKKVVSHEAICGAYYFKNSNTFRDAATKYLLHCSYKEFFMSGVFNEIISPGNTIITFQTDEHISFGTPEEYELAVTDKRLEKLL